MLACALSLWAVFSDVAAASPPLPLGRVEVMPFVGRITFDRKLGLQPAILYGGEIAQSSLVDHPLVVVGTYARLYGAQTAIVVVDDDDGVDVINGAAGASFGFRGLGRVLPYVRGGIGFIFIDASPSGFDVRGRLTTELAAGARAFPCDWLVVKAELGLLMHDNLPLGAGSGQLGNDVHVFPTLGVGVVR